MASFYQSRIREDLARAGVIGRYDPADVEAWIRVGHSTLDGLSASEFRREINEACACIEEASADETRAVRESFGL